jgi:competence protein ComGC
MKIFSRRLTTKAFTLIELLTIIVAIAVIVAVLVPLTSRPRVYINYVNCSNNLKQIGLSVRLWANDNGDRFPISVSTNQGGSLESIQTSDAFRHFQTLSNELSTPKVIVCPQDSRTAATNWWSTDLNNSKVSYFVGLEADESKPQTILSGDRNITTGFLPRNGTLWMATNRPVGWAAQIHTNAGNICFSDGGVQFFTSSGLRRHYQRSGLPATRLAVP